MLILLEKKQNGYVPQFTIICTMPFVFIKCKLQFTKLITKLYELQWLDAVKVRNTVVPIDSAIQS